MTRLVKALGKLDKEFGEASFREKDYPSALFHGLHAVTKLKKFTMGGMQQFNYEGFISTTANKSVALSFAGGISTLPSSGSERRGNCLIQLKLNDSYLETSSKTSKSGSLKKRKAHKFAGFVGDVSWLSQFPHEKEYLIFTFETFPVIGVTEDFEGTSQKRYHVVTGGTSGQLSTPLEHLYASFRTRKKPIAPIAPIFSVPIVKAPVKMNILQNIALKLIPTKETVHFSSSGQNMLQNIALKPTQKQQTKHTGSSGQNMFQNIALKPIPKKETEHIGCFEHNMFQNIALKPISKMETKHTGTYGNEHYTPEAFQIALNKPGESELHTGPAITITTPPITQGATAIFPITLVLSMSLTKAKPGSSVAPKQTFDMAKPAAEAPLKVLVEKFINPQPNPSLATGHVTMETDLPLKPEFKTLSGPVNTSKSDIIVKSPVAPKLKIANSEAKPIILEGQTLQSSVIDCRNDQLKAKLCKPDPVKLALPDGIGIGSEENLDISIYTE